MNGGRDGYLDGDRHRGGGPDVFGDQHAGKKVIAGSRPTLNGKKLPLEVIHKEYHL
jgi:hypothetical protein